MRHDSARAGWSSRSSSNAVSVSKNWAMTAALPASPAGRRIELGRRAEQRSGRAVAAAVAGDRTGAGEQGDEQDGHPAAHRREYTGGGPVQAAGRRCRLDAGHTADMR